jgi:serine O-acetyltransferase
MNAISAYRLGNWLLRKGVPIAPRMVYFATYALFNSSIPPGCEIGRGARFAYGGIGVVIHGQCKIGRNVLIGPNVTLGGNFGSGVPTVGDNVFIGPGVRILGEITVGNNVILGANAVILHDVPDNCIAAGVPGRVIRRIAPGTLDAIAGTLFDGSGAGRRAATATVPDQA